MCPLSVLSCPCCALRAHTHTHAHTMVSVSNVDPPSLHCTHTDTASSLSAVGESSLCHCHPACTNHRTLLLCITESLFTARTTCVWTHTSDRTWTRRASSPWPFSPATPISHATAHRYQNLLANLVKKKTAY